MSIYFIRAGEAGPVKIGRTVNIPFRMAHLQIANADELLLIRVIEGPSKIETWAHAAFDHLWIRGEWFRFSAEMLTWVPKQTVLPDPRRGWDRYAPYEPVQLYDNVPMPFMRLP